jgi:hypothetical protein
LRHYFKPFNKNKKNAGLIFTIFVVIKSFKKYLFAFVVSSYVISVIGVPVYFHYCGGLLEEISYVVKSNDCCGSEENDPEKAGNDCCKDENIVLKSNLDFTIKHNAYAFVKTFCELFYIALPLCDSFQTKMPIQLLTSEYAEFPPPKLQHDLVISTSVLRI